MDEALSLVGFAVFVGEFFANKFWLFWSHK
jgi:hypothetical protein